MCCLASEHVCIPCSGSHVCAMLPFHPASGQGDVYSFAVFATVLGELQVWVRLMGAARVERVFTVLSGCIQVQCGIM